MRLDARYPPHYHDWFVWHVEQCCAPKYVVWVDDETHQYGQHGAHVFDGLIVVQAKKIQIIPARKLILINPLDDNENQDACVRAESKPLLTQSDA